jgi:hypothetical protein
MRYVRERKCCEGTRSDYDVIGWSGGIDEATRHIQPIHHLLYSPRACWTLGTKDREYVQEGEEK